MDTPPVAWDSLPISGGEGRSVDTGSTDMEGNSKECCVCSKSGSNFKICLFHPEIKEVEHRGSDSQNNKGIEEGNSFIPAASAG